MEGELPSHSSRKCLQKLMTGISSFSRSWSSEKFTLKSRLTVWAVSEADGRQKTLKKVDGKSCTCTRTDGGCENSPRFQRPSESHLTHLMEDAQGPEPLPKPAGVHTSMRGSLTQPDHATHHCYLCSGSCILVIRLKLTRSSTSASFSSRLLTELQPASSR